MILYLRTACLSSFICNIPPHVFPRAADSCCFQLFFSLSTYLRSNVSVSSLFCFGCQVTVRPAWVKAMWRLCLFFFIKRGYSLRWISLCRVHTAQFSKSLDHCCFHTARLPGVAFSCCCDQIARWIGNRRLHTT